MPRSKPLPDCEGPKLECFLDDITTDDFKILGYLGGGCHSNVFKAQIHGEVYAIKIFSDYPTKEPSFMFSAFENFPETDPNDWEIEPVVPNDELSQSTIDSLRLHATSFYNECRVFGRLKELDREHLAIKAYGYLEFNLDDERVQQKFLPFLEENKRQSAYSQGKKDLTTADTIRDLFQHDDLKKPLMAIVKEWIPLPGSQAMPFVLTQKQMRSLPQLLRNLHGLHKSGIVVRDLKMQQYLDGKLADFSFAWTIPHIFDPESGIKPRWSFESMAAWDLKCFQDMLDCFDRRADETAPRMRKHNLVAWRKDDVYDRLRPRPQMYGPSLPMLIYDSPVQPMMHRPPFDPAKFNWRAVQKPTKKGAGRVTKTKAPQRRATKKRGSK
ncbi:uncharacterized protein FTJAE_671 [Fusarium tjaetaba]|uniref:Protein kinase domain-containing protein n=1 Tax=Fusarium tjaetaba TaxID=1567544 RepID=A0A8H5SGC0_9HYPO|nr:uncharacterized protein FTJAE_671 [Fusarium tjaetaba]KAF5650106.1 hypothetical protein FTJAE_671 [Fusarium tjaetaba]